MFTRFSIADVPVSERPRERFRTKGPQAVSLHELLSITIASGYKDTSAVAVAEQLLTRFHTISAIESCAIEELRNIPGIGPVKAVRIKAALELGKRFANEHRLQSAPTMLNSTQASVIASYHLKGKMQEHLLSFSLNVRGMLIDEPDVICIGILDASCIHPREIFKRAIQKSAASVLLAHNHPSGNPEPSNADLESTHSIWKAGQIIGISLVDHLVIADTSHVSIREQHPGLFSDNGCP